MAGQVMSRCLWPLICLYDLHLDQVGELRAGKPMDREAQEEVDRLRPAIVAVLRRMEEAP